MTETYSVTQGRLPTHDGPKPLGRNINHDSRSRLFPFRSLTPRRVTTVSHIRHIDIFDQGRVGSCTGNAALGCLGTGIFYETLRRRFDDSVTDEWTEEEAVEIYSLATTLDPWPGSYPPDDTGSDGVSVAKVAQRRNYISGYEHAFNLDQALQALMERPIIIGVNWYNNFFHPDATTGEITTQPGDTVAGGHEIVLDGYSADSGRLVASNSWGTSWGRGGRFTLHRDLLDRLLREDGDCTVFTPLTLEPPEPEPGPTYINREPAIDALEIATRAWRRRRYPSTGAARAQRDLNAFMKKVGR